MAASEQLGIIGLDSYHFFTKDPGRSHRFYTEGFGWRASSRSSAAMVSETGQASTVYEAGTAKVVVSHPVQPTCRAARYLKRHPAGIGSLSFRVEDAAKAWDFLVGRGATPIHELRESRSPNGGRFRHFSITTPIGDVAYRFLERTDYSEFAPGFEAIPAEQGAPVGEELGFVEVDHVTNNGATIAPIKLWFEHVLGMEQCWEIEFHTEDVKKGGESGTGLRSAVMWDPRSQLKFPINEPLAPFFKEGQINIFIEQNWGAGIQHLALVVTDIERAVTALRQRGIGFLGTPAAYYTAAPARLSKNGVDVHSLAHDLGKLQSLGILIDGKPENRYLLQIFLQEAAVLHGDEGAGPFFYELIQRCGDDGFGEGNFRALFESIERQQVSDGVAA
jgi:4-hydroxyphenylpyruvate dioxygenase